MKKNIAVQRQRQNAPGLCRAAFFMDNKGRKQSEYLLSGYFLREKVNEFQHIRT